MTWVSPRRAQPRVFHPCATAMAFADVLDESEAHAGPSDGRGGGATAPGRPTDEAFDDALAVFYRNPGSAVNHPHNDGPVVTLGPDGNDFASRCILERMVARNAARSL